jgi:hypothetical protein
MLCPILIVTLQNNTNKKAVGKLKDEEDGQIWSEFVGLRPKMYSASIDSLIGRCTM